MLWNKESYLSFYFTACDEQHYGENCTETCNCTSNICNALTGECQCAAGKQSPPDCNENCPSGTFGLRCIGVCNCQNGATCDPVDGTCYWRKGFQGDKCHHEVTTTNTIRTGKVLSLFFSPNYYYCF